MKKCIIIGAGGFSGFHPEYMADYVIAADGGYNHLIRHGFTPNLLIGDLDSIGDYSDYNGEIVRFPVKKDASDLELAVIEAIGRGFDCFYIYGALGKRLDHTLGNMAVLASISRKGFQGWLVGENEVITAVSNSKLVLPLRESGTVSVFAAGGTAMGVSLSGLKYPLLNAALACDSTLGLSNEFIGENAVIEVRDGTLMVIINLEYVLNE